MVFLSAGITGISKPQYTPPRSFSEGPKQAKTASVRAEVLNFSVQTVGLAQTDINRQNALYHFKQLPDEIKKELVYEGRPISEFSPQEAADLLSEDGYFGVAKTSARVSDFVLRLAGDDPEKLRIGRDAVIKGFKEAEKLWGGQLPDICYQTLDKTLGTIDDKIKDAGGAVVDLTA